MSDFVYLVSSRPSLVRFPNRVWEGESYPGFTLIPGQVNKVPSKAVELAKKLPPGSRWFTESGFIKEVPAPEAEAPAAPAPEPVAAAPEPEPEPAPEPEPELVEEDVLPDTLEGLSASDAKEMARSCSDKKTLEVWLEGESRSSVRKAIRSQLEE